MDQSDLVSDLSTENILAIDWSLPISSPPQVYQSCCSAAAELLARVNTGQVPAPGETQGRDWELRTHNLDVLVKVTGDLEED